MRKLVLFSLIGILSFLFMSCGFTEGTVTVYNDSDIVVRVIYLDNKSYSGDDTIVRFMYLTKGQSYSLDVAEARYELCTDNMKNGYRLGKNIEVFHGEETVVKTSQMKYEYLPVE